MFGNYFSNGFPVLGGKYKFNFDKHFFASKKHFSKTRGISMFLNKQSQKFTSKLKKKPEFMIWTLLLLTIRDVQQSQTRIAQRT